MNRIVCLSNPHDEDYATLRGEEVEPCLSAPKRRDLFRCLELAAGKPLLVLSSPPRARQRRQGKWLPAVQTRFSTHPQFFCANWDGPKLRVPLSWFFYAWHLFRHIRSGDLLVFDNYEFMYVVAAWCVRPFRRVRFLLDYEDGKHLIDRSWSRVLSGTAEWLGRRLLRAAFLAHPALGQRLPAGVPSLLIPGFLRPPARARLKPSAGEGVQLLYSGSLDRTRGVDVLLAALPLLPGSGWHLHITGQGPLAAEISPLAKQDPWRDRITFHQVLPNDAYAELVGRCQVGLNCQRETDPISAVTFPSKVFSYLSAGLMVVSSRASAVPAICGEACHYFESDSAASLAEVLSRVIGQYDRLSGSSAGAEAMRQYTVEGTAVRVRELLTRAGLLEGGKP